jgi:diacylglycerol kinase
MKSPSLIASFKYAWEGITHAFRSQRNFRIHVAVSSAVLAAGLALGVGGTEWAALILTIGLVFLAELFNTALEAIVDHVAPEFHALAKIAKDCAAGAVFVAALAAVGVGVAIFGPRVLGLLR